MQKNGYKYEKTEKSIMEICNHTNYQQICNNAKAVYEKLEINDNNWLDIEDGYSEIFKLAN